MRRLALVFAISVLTGCGNGPTAPTSQIPDVAGTYAGPYTMHVTVNNSFQGSARLDVAQAGAQLTITGSMTLLGTPAQVPAVRGTISATGVFTPSAGGAGGVVNDACGAVTTTATTITFFGRTLRWIEAASTEFCNDFEIEALLEKL